MINIKRLISILLVAAIIILPSCSGKFSSDDSELVIGVEDITAEFNPLYAVNESDKAISSQIFSTVQRMNSHNALVNHCGGISYELIGENQVKYTVTLRDDLFFSDGTNVTIDDLIFFYHLISDATYDGVYSDWHLNDIVGLNEYYYDDVDYYESVAELEEEIEANYSPLNISKSDFINYLIANGLEGKFVGGLDSISPSGKSWREYLTELEYTDELEALGETPADMELLKVAAKAEAENNPLAYSPQSYYREILFGQYLGSNYSDGTDVTSISGITKINDYSCTILFNSSNINAVSEINIPIMSRAVYASDYIKGNAPVVKEKSSSAIGAGPYMLKESGNNVVLKANEYYFGGQPDFATLRFVDLKAEDIDPVEAINKGDVDIISVTATDDVIESLDSDKIKTSVSNNREYVSIFFNTNTLELGERKALAGFCHFNNLLSDEIGRHYTAVYMPLSIRFEEYPSDIKSPVYSENTYSNYLRLNAEGIESVTAYCVYPKNSLEYTVLENYKSILEKNGIKAEIVLVDSEGLLKEAIALGKADIWIETVSDNATCDKFDYYNSMGEMNKTGINDAEIDALSSSLHSAVGFSDRKAMVKSLLNLVMAQAVECPLYQLQTVTAYNTDKISPESFGDDFDYDGFTIVLPLLKRK